MKSFTIYSYLLSNKKTSVKMVEKKLEQIQI